MPSFLTAIPQRARAVIYAVYTLAGVAFGAATVAFATAEVDVPMWFKIAFAVYAYLGTALGVVATANTGNGTPAEPQVNYEVNIESPNGVPPLA